MTFPSTSFSQQYIAALSRYLLNQDKARLEDARGLIKTFAESGLTSHELSSAYQSALSQALASAATREECIRRAEVAAVFLAESLSALDDISKKTQTALYESSGRYRQMFEKNQAVKLLIDPESGDIVDANPAASEFYGYSIAALRSMKITDINTASRAQVAAEMERARTERRVYFIFKHRLASGDVRDVEVYSGPIDIQGQRLLFSIIHDITERRKAEKLLQQSLLNYQSLVSTLDGIVWEMDGQTFSYSFISQQAERLLGYPLKRWHNEPDFWKNHLHADDRERVVNYCLAAIANQKDYVLEYRMLDASGQTVWLQDTVTVIIENGDTIKLRGVMIDITERKWAEAELQKAHSELEARVEERTAELARSNALLKQQIRERERAEEALHASERELTIRNRIANIFLTHPSEETYEQVLQIILEAMESTLGILGYIDHNGDLICPSLSREIWDQCQMAGKDIIFPKGSWGGIWGRALAEKQSFYSNKPFSVPMGHIPVVRALSTPILHQGEVVGHVLVANKITDYDETDRERLETIIAHVAPILHARLERDQKEKERQRAEESEREQRALAEALREIVAALNSTLDLNKVLELILDNIGRVVPHDAANIMLIDCGIASIVRQHGYTEYGLSELLEAQEFVITEMPSFYQMIETGKPVVVADKNGPPPWNDIPQTRSLLSYVGAPVQLEGEIIGFINLDSTQPDFFSSTHAERLQIFADQAATAIQNARLYQRSHDLAALEERQRLARDLHDAVSQTLFSASVIAEALPRLWDRDPQEVRNGLDELHLLTRGALAEMRTLLLELRPSALVETSFDELIRQLTLAFTGKTRIPVELVVTAMQPLPAHVQIALYRMVQEALNNVAKHARATQVIIQLDCGTEQLSLQIKDNGRGFNPDLVSSGRLGLRFMGERAADIGAELRLTSQSSVGTEISIIWPAHE